MVLLRSGANQSGRAGADLCVAFGRFRFDNQTPEQSLSGQFRIAEKADPKLTGMDRFPERYKVHWDALPSGP